MTLRTNTKAAIGRTAIDRTASAELDRLDRLCAHFDGNAAGIRVAWRSLGAGPNLLLIHGGQGDWTHWIANLEFLAQHYRIWLPDLPGFGDSDEIGEQRLAQPTPTQAHQAIDRIASAVQTSFEQQLGSDGPLFIASFSFGALIAARPAKTLDRAQALALMGPAGHGKLRGGAINFIDWRRARTDQERVEALRSNLQLLMFSSTAALDPLALEAYVRAGARTRFQSKPYSRGDLLITLLAELRLPVLALWGEDDVTAVAAVAGPAVTADRPERQWRAIAGAGHWLQYEQAAAVQTLLHHWFSELAE